MILTFMKDDRILLDQFTPVQAAELYRCKEFDVIAAINGHPEEFESPHVCIREDGEIYLTDRGLYKLSFYLTTSIAKQNRDSMVNRVPMDEDWYRYVKSFKFES